MIEERISTETLQEKLDAISHGFTKRQKKYYYIESIQNFIYHLNSFPSERTQKRMADAIHSYLFLLQEKLSEEHDLHLLAKELLPHVWKIGNAYKDELGFINKPSYSFRLIFGLALFFILKSSFDVWIALGIVTILAITTTIHVEMKRRKRKFW